MILACLILLSLILLVVLLVAWWSRPAPQDTLLRQHLHARYLVTVGSGETFDGLLGQVDGRTLLLREVSVLKADGSLTRVDGEVVLRRESVSYMQKPSDRS